MPENTGILIRPYVKWAISEGADIVASGTAGVIWEGGFRVGVERCPGGVTLSYDGHVTVCSLEQLGHVLLAIDMERR